MKKKTGNSTRSRCLLLTASIITMQIASGGSIYASDEQEYTGTTQISTNDVYPSLDTSAVELIVEEVYAQEGNSLSKGDKILKLTDDSYQAALSYYEAAIIKADSALTDTQLEYDQGVLEAKYTCESAEADAQNAEYIRTYQTNEVEEAITDHEEMLEDIDERIADLEEGIADGSYDTSGSSVSTSGMSGGSGSTVQDGKKTSEKQPESESETETEAAQTESDADQTETETERDDQRENESEPEKTDSSQNGNNNPQESQKTTEELRQELTTKMAEAEEIEKNLEEKLKNILENEDGKNLDSGSYSVYTEQLQNIIFQMEADVKGQEQVKNILSTYEDSEENTSQKVLNESIEGDQRVLDSLKDIQEKMTTYEALISSAMGLLGSDADTALADKDLLAQMSDYLSRQAEINKLCMELLEKYESEMKEIKEKTDNSEQKTPESDTSKPGIPEQTTPGQNTDMGNSQAENQAGGFSSGSMSNMAGNMSEAGTESAQGSAGTIQGDNTAMSGETVLSGEDISLLGDTYDLTKAEQLLSREPSDSEEAQDLIDELEESRETTETQYEELQRKKKIFELEIQHTYDTAILEGKLAELTYQQEKEEWEETLAEAKQTKADLEKQKALLEAMTDGILYADQTGTVASMSYEAEDILDSSIPIISFYKTDTVSILLEVDQEEIAAMSVGEKAEITIAGAGRVEGTITEKSVEPEDGTSRTAVKYTVTVSVDNEDGRLSDGQSATVRFTENEIKSDEEAAANES